MTERFDAIVIGAGPAGLTAAYELQKRSPSIKPVVFEAAVKPHLFHAEVRRQLASRRAGTGPRGAAAARTGASCARPAQLPGA